MHALRNLFIAFVLPGIVVLGGALVLRWLWHIVPDTYAEHPTATIVVIVLVLLYAALVTYRIHKVGLRVVLWGDPHLRAKRKSAARRRK